MSEQKQDMIDRKVDGVVKIFGLAYKDVVALVATISILLNVYLVNKVISTNEDLNAKIVDEVRKQVEPAVERKVSDGLEPIREGVNEIKNMAIEVKDKVRKDSLK